MFFKQQKYSGFRNTWLEKKSQSRVARERAMVAGAGRRVEAARATALSIRTPSWTRTIAQMTLESRTVHGNRKEPSGAQDQAINAARTKVQAQFLDRVAGKLRPLRCA